MGFFLQFKNCHAPAFPLYCCKTSYGKGATPLPYARSPFCTLGVGHGWVAWRVLRSGSHSRKSRGRLFAEHTTGYDEKLLYSLGTCMEDWSGKIPSQVIGTYTVNSHCSLEQCSTKSPPILNHDSQVGVTHSPVPGRLWSLYFHPSISIFLCVLV